MRTLLTILVATVAGAGMLWGMFACSDQLDREGKRRYENQQAVRLLRIEKGHVVTIDGHECGSKNYRDAVFVSCRFQYTVSIDGGPDFQWTPDRFGDNWLPAEPWSAVYASALTDEYGYESIMITNDGVGCVRHCTWPPKVLPMPFSEVIRVLSDRRFFVKADHE